MDRALWAVVMEAYFSGVSNRKVDELVVALGCENCIFKSKVSRICQTVILAVGITATGQREVLGIEVGDSEDEAFWTAFLRRLRERGLAGVQLVIRDAHASLK